MAPARIADCRLYGFIDTAYLRGRDPGELTRALIAGGVDIIQVRAKDFTHAQRAELGHAVLEVATEHNVPVVINDDLEAATAIGAAGVHWGQEDWPIVKQRPAGVRLLGISTHSLAQAEKAKRDGADYIGVGPVYATSTKAGVMPVGLELVQTVASRVSVPFFAIGGITLQNIDEVLDAGATRVAVVSAILGADDVVQAAMQFKKRLEA
jgi:thiamine-phosphate pyrophosphorylase